MTVAAVYRNGVFEPIEPVNAQEGTPARVELLAPPANEQPGAEAISAAVPALASGAVDPSTDWSWRSLGYITYVSPDFDEPLEDFKEYME